MLLSLDCPTKMLKVVSVFSDFETVSAYRCKEDADYKKYLTSSSLSKILNCDCKITPEIATALAKELGCHLIITSEPLSFKDFPDVMGVVKGDDFPSVAECISTYLENKVTSLAVPFSICGQKGDSPEVMAGKRVLATNLIPPEMPVHLLGFVSLSEFWWYKSRINMSINTGSPVLMGLQDKDILEPLTEKVSTYDSFLKTPAEKSKWGQVCRNVAILRKYL